ncbi:hypothetical protein CKO38_17165 [Rhodospirillum rubrum]|nr:hypothetical protein [Rhodospirillum rubrum]MBK1678367.1 hypothetical protein [Rhodospirillum rubrum]
MIAGARPGRTGLAPWRRGAVLGGALVILAACQSADGLGGRHGALPPLTVDSPSALIGRDERGLRGVLGEPALLRRDGSAQVWQYRGRGCVLDFVLYEDGGRLGVAYAEARGRGGGAADPKACLRDVHHTASIGEVIAL